MKIMESKLDKDILTGFFSVPNLKENILFQKVGALLTLHTTQLILNRTKTVLKTNIYDTFS